MTVKSFIFLIPEIYDLDTPLTTELTSSTYIPPNASAILFMLVVLMLFDIIFINFSFLMLEYTFFEGKPYTIELT